MTPGFQLVFDHLSGRGGQIRTDDILLPKQALYQAELRPVFPSGDSFGAALAVHGRTLVDSADRIKKFLKGNFILWIFIGF